MSQCLWMNSDLVQTTEKKVWYIQICSFSFPPSSVKMNIFIVIVTVIANVIIIVIVTAMATVSIIVIIVSLS